MEIFTLKEQSACALRWTPEGELKGGFVRTIIGKFGLARDEDSAMRFTRDCEFRVSQPPETSAGDDPEDYWLTCLNELSLVKESDSLWKFVMMINLGDQLSSRTITSAELAIRRLDNIVKPQAGISTNFPHSRFVSGDCKSGGKHRAVTEELPPLNL